MRRLVWLSVVAAFAIAYPLLTHNRRLFALDSSVEREVWGQYVLDRDTEYLTANPESTLFAYFTALEHGVDVDRPRNLSKAVIEDRAPNSLLSSPHPRGGPAGILE